MGHIHYIQEYSLFYPEYRNYFDTHLLCFSPFSQMSIFEDYMGHMLVQSFWNLQKYTESSSLSLIIRKYQQN